MVLGLPDTVRPCLFDLDGVITDTAAVHAATWKETFDELLQEQEGAGFRPFTVETDYRRLVDGRLRADGVRAFLASRGIELPDGAPDAHAGLDTVHGLGRWKSALFEDRIRSEASLSAKAPWPTSQRPATEGCLPRSSPPAPTDAKS